MTYSAGKFDIETSALLRSSGFVNGKWVSSATGKSIQVSNPADQQQIGQVTRFSSAESADVVDIAQRSFAGWSSQLPQQRSAILRRWFELVMESREELAQIMVLEQGKPISEARGEIDYAASFIEYYAEEAKRPNIESVTSHLADAEMEIWLEPVGVVALITPWNFPSAMLTRKAAAALAAGCTIVAHPSEEAPFSALALCELAAQAGLPEGVLNVVTGHAPEIVEPWTQDPRVRALSFTGSTEIGRLLYGQCAATVKKLVLELGGHAPFIVFDDADIDLAVEEAIKAKFATSGQDCLGANRVYIQRNIYEAFCQKFLAAAKALSVGPGHEDPDIGPLMNARAVGKQEEHVADALARGAKIGCGGTINPLGPLFFNPTVLLDVPDDALIMREESFGPVAPLSPFDDESELLERANASEFGLVAYLHTNDPRRIYRMSRALQYGMVAVNRTKVTGAPIPFGGMKQSGLGREGARQGMEEFMEIKYVCRDWA
ncbi:MAG: NAD-dependent succinate-semialdehyde dehydrogenase [Rhizobiaceae bacterium]